MTLTETSSRVRTTRLSISEVVHAWADGTLANASSHAPGESNWYGGSHRSGYYSSPNPPSLVAEGQQIISRSELLGIRYEKEWPGGGPVAVDDGTPAQRYWYLLNADAYPRGGWGVRMAINDHQGQIRSAVTGREHYLIPFSALRAAGLRPDELEFIDKRTDSTVEVPADTCRFCRQNRAEAAEATPEKCSSRGHFERYQEEVVYADGEKPINPMTGGPYMRMGSRWVYDDALPHVFTRDEHLMGASLFRVHSKGEVVWDRTAPDGWRTVEKDRYFLSAVDETGTDPRNAYFLTELVTDDEPPEGVARQHPEYNGHPETLEQAYEWLKPAEVFDAEAGDTEVRRQGEWFFIQQNDEMGAVLTAEERRLERAFKGVERGRLKNMPLPNPPAETWDGRGVRRAANHIAFRLINYEETTHFLHRLYVRGKVTHATNDHPTMTFPEGTWWRAVHNVQVMSWSAGVAGAHGRVD